MLNRRGRVAEACRRCAIAKGSDAAERRPRTAASVQASFLPRLTPEIPGAAIPACEPPSAIQRNSRLVSAALCQRSSGSFARQVFTTRSRAGGDIGWTVEIGAGSSFMIEEISDAWLVPEKAFLPVAIS